MGGVTGREGEESVSGWVTGREEEDSVSGWGDREGRGGECEWVG